MNRIFLADHMVPVEIGVFPDEYGVSQRLRFDVEVEVDGPPEQDRVDDVVSYDTIVEGIETIAAGPRLQLLETFAEALARRCLASPRAIRVRVRIAKLDRLASGGVLGVEIVRERP